jgi:hypothetical protein
MVLVLGRAVHVPAVAQGCCVAPMVSKGRSSRRSRTLSRRGCIRRLGWGARSALVEDLLHTSGYLQSRGGLRRCRRSAQIGKIARGDHSAHTTATYNCHPQLPLACSISSEHRARGSTTPTARSSVLQRRSWRALHRKARSWNVQARQRQRQEPAQAGPGARPPSLLAHRRCPPQSSWFSGPREARPFCSSPRSRCGLGCDALAAQLSADRRQVNQSRRQQVALDSKFSKVVNFLRKQLKTDSVVRACCAGRPCWARRWAGPRCSAPGGAGPATCGQPPPRACCPLAVRLPERGVLTCAGRRGIRAHAGARSSLCWWCVC